MISIRQIIVILLLIAVLWLLRRLRFRLATIRHRLARQTAASQEMVRCNHCGVYILRSRAITISRHSHFCNKEHYIADRERSDRSAS